MPDKYNARRAIDYRHNVATYLRLWGLNVDLPKHPKLSEVMADPMPGSSIAGVPDHVVITRANVHARPAEALASAQDAAKDAGLNHAVVIMARPDREVGESFVVTTLDDWTELMREREGVQS